MFDFTFMPDVGMGYVHVSLDPYTLFECFLAWPSLHPFTFLEMFLLSLYIEECTNLIATHISTLTGRCTLGTV